MLKEFKSNKLQMKVTNANSPKAFHRLFNNVCESPSDEQVTAVVTVLESLTGDNIQSINLSTSQQLTLNK